MKKFLLPLLLLPVLSGCHPPEPPPTLIEFQNDPQILRGRWSGQVSANQTLTLDLTATYKQEYFYAVTGTGKLGAQALTAEGTVVAAYNHRFIQPQTSPIPQGVRLRLTSGPENRELLCPDFQGTAGQSVWKCFYRSADTILGPFDLKRDNL
ncbi:hypothetical protein DEIPH_ctg029orf0029 [Deinococcus phoenicis]|uniref:Lipoprotein n=1 Tax=Deinococcus phoenicis TaxID=1476583 RepID=A0A016QQK7_9DEIO|nr:hypothetical protein [Deinococcus phoenicis]EYB68024.1 hypothetical protein DEIPH_ctg029orf0029 [Deinococcus phoenicis]